MMPEGFVAKTVVSVHYGDLQNLIKEKYLLHKVAPKYSEVYSVAAGLESSNDVEHLLPCDGSFTWEDDRTVLNEWIENDEPPKRYTYPYYPHPASFINKLIRDGVLEAGDYLVSVSW